MKLYTANELKEAYDKWVETHHLVTRTAFSQNISVENMRLRNEAWDHYCDVRDGESPGTNATRRANYFTRSSHIKLVSSYN